MTENASGQFDDLQDLDRLVDGELPERERHELLGRLDRHPDGWRRLALAFLEAQSWGEAARDHATEAVTTATGDVRPVMPSIPPARNWKLLLGTPLAMAASFLVAFTLGIALRGAWRGSDPNLPLQVASQKAQQEQAARKAIVLAHGSFGQTLSSLANNSKDRPSGESEFAVADDLGSVSLANSGPLSDDAVEEVWLPAEAEASDESTLAGSPAPAVPEQVLRSLRRLGHEVESHQSFWPVDLKNGQRALVPVDEVEIRYVGNDYQ